MPDPANLKVTLDKTAEIEKALKALSNTSVLVGIPSDDERQPGELGSETRVQSAIGNAALAYIHENGSPAQNIPARPFFQPGVNESKDRWASYLEQAGAKAFEGNATAMDRALHAAGMTAVAAVKNRIAAGIPPPLAQSTVDARRKRSKGSSYRRKAATAADTTPLIDTGQMINSITYVIRKKTT